MSEGKHVTRCRGGYHASDTFGTCSYCGREIGGPCQEAFVIAEAHKRDLYVWAGILDKDDSHPTPTKGGGDA